MNQNQPNTLTPDYFKAVYAANTRSYGIKARYGIDGVEYPLYMNDKTEGPFVHYWPTGKLKAKDRFKHNKLDGWIQRFDSFTGKVDSVLF